MMAHELRTSTVTDSELSDQGEMLKCIVNGHESDLVVTHNMDEIFYSR